MQTPETGPGAGAPAGEGTPVAAAPTTDADPTPTPPPGNQAVITILERYLTEARAGKISGILVAYTTPQGASEIHTSPMGVVLLNHLARLVDRKINREYDRAAAVAQAARSPGTMPARSPATGPATEKKDDKKKDAAAPSVPRVVRRQLAKAEVRRRMKQGRTKR
jgi:hypothetical protein